MTITLIICRYMDGIIREATEIEFHLNNISFCLRKSWKPLICSLKDCNEPPSQVLHWAMQARALALSLLGIYQPYAFCFLTSCLLYLELLIICCAPTPHIHDLSCPPYSSSPSHYYVSKRQKQPCSEPWVVSLPFSPLLLFSSFLSYWLILVLRVS